MNTATWPFMRALIIACVLLNAGALPVNYPSSQKPRPGAGGPLPPISDRLDWWYDEGPFVIPPPAAARLPPDLQPQHDRPHQLPPPQQPGSPPATSLLMSTDSSPMSATVPSHLQVPVWPPRPWTPGTPLLNVMGRPRPQRQQTLPRPPTPPKEEWWMPNKVVPPLRPQPPAPPIFTPPDFPTPPTSPSTGTPPHNRPSGSGVADEAGKPRRKQSNAAPGYGSSSDESSFLAGGSGKSLQRGVATKKALSQKGAAARGIAPRKGGTLNRGSSPLRKGSVGKGNVPQKGTLSLKKTIAPKQISGKGGMLTGTRSRKKPVLLSKSPTKQSAKKQPARRLAGGMEKSASKPPSQQKPAPNARKPKLQARPKAVQPAPKKRMTQVKKRAKL